MPKSWVSANSGLTLWYAWSKPPVVAESAPMPDATAEAAVSRFDFISILLGISCNIQILLRLLK